MCSERQLNDLGTQIYTLLLLVCCLAFVCCVGVGEREGDRFRARYRVFVAHYYIYVTLGNDVHS